MTTNRPAGLTGRILATWLLANRTELSAEGCLLWTGHRDKDGYGAVQFEGRNHGSHRLIKKLIEGIPDESMVADHICKVRACVNPNHIRWVTDRENALENTDSVVAKNLQKDRCSCGLDFEPRKAGGRWCRSCHLKASAERYKRKRRGAAADPRFTL